MTQDTRSLSADIAKICFGADEVLWAAFAYSQDPSMDRHPERKLLFPRYRSNDLRVSEQEARFAFVETLCSSAFPFLYTVEAPTRKLYQFEGKTSSISAQTDLAICDPAGRPICNVEFKAKGKTPSAKSQSDIEKDIQKLLRERAWGLWFHLLESVNKSTLTGLLAVLGSQIELVCRTHDDIDTPGLTIHICVLSHGFAIHKDIGLEENIRNQLELELSPSETTLERVANLNGWTLHPQPSG